MLRVAGSWSTTTRSTAPNGSASSASLVRTKVNGQISPWRSSVASGSPGDDEIGGEDEGDELVMVDRARQERRGAGLRELHGLEIHHPVAIGHHRRGRAGGAWPDQVQHGPHV